jgi:tetratricopeptide (TPR) repeat protein
MIKRSFFLLDWYYFHTFNQNSEAMTKIILCLILSVLILTNCSNDNDTHEKLSEIERLLEKEKYELAMNNLSDINVKRLNEENKAYYDLLMTQANFCLDKQTDSDSLINESIRFYEENNNKILLAKAYYYKGITCYQRGNKSEGINLIKKAEHLAKGTSDLNFITKIYINLSFINIDTGNYQTGLSYAKKALQTARKANNKILIALSMNKINAAFNCMGKIDSCLVYSQKTIPYIKYLNKNDKLEVLTNISIGFVNKGLYDEAILYAKKSLEIKPNAHAYYIIGSIYFERGENQKAWQLLNDALNTNGLELKAEVLLWMADLKKEEGKYKEASELEERALAIKDSIKTKQQTEHMLSLQNNAERKAADEQAQNRLVIAISAVMVFAAAVMISMLAYNRRRRNATKRQIEDISRTTEQYRQKISELDKEKDKNEKEIERLNKKIESLKERRMTILGHGRMLYDELEKGGKTITWKKDDYEAVIEYYRTIDPKTIESIERNYKKLTPYNTFILIMADKGKTNNEIMQTTGISYSALRTMKHRINKVKNEE